MFKKLIPLLIGLFIGGMPAFAAQQVINVGAAPGDGTGDPGRTAFQKTNANFTDLYTQLGTAQTAIASIQTSGLQYFGTDSGAANAYVVTASVGSVGCSLTSGTLLRFTAANADTGASTLNACGTGVKNIVSQNNVALVGGEILTTGPTWVQYTGSAWQIVGTGATPDKVRTPTEISASVVPVNWQYAPYNVLRYETNSTPGTTDMTVGIQNAMNSVPSGGAVLIPTGYYLYSSLSSTKAFSLIGQGYTSSVQDIFGAAAWANLANFSGSVLISTASSGNSILLGTAGTNQNLRIEDLMIVGPGSGTANGLHMLRGVGSFAKNVLIANFSVGWLVDNEQDFVFIAPRAKGCATGMILQGSITSNQGGIYGAEIQSFNTFGLHYIAAAQVNLYSPIFQDGRGGYAVQIDAASSQNEIHGGWFEANTTQTGALNIIGSQNKIAHCNFGDSKDHVFLQSGADRNKIEDNVFQPSVGESPSLIINSGATNTRILDSVPYAGGSGPGGSGNTYQDNGINTTYTTTDNGTINQQSGARATFGSDSLSGLPGAGGTATRLVKNITGIADNTFTAMAAVLIPNAAESATVHAKFVCALGAGGAVGADEASMTLTEDLVLARTSGLATVVTAATTYGSAAASVAGGATITVAFDNTSISGANSATQTLTMRASVARGSGSSTNHSCVVEAEIMNANASGVTIS